jgi:hypothetical protein
MMAVINYDDCNNQFVDNQYNWPIDDTTSGTTGNWTIYANTTCPHCLGWISWYQIFHYCPYCGKPLHPKPDKKAEILKKLDKILKEVEEIKEELLK